MCAISPWLPKNDQHRLPSQGELSQGQECRRAGLAPAQSLPQATQVWAGGLEAHGKALLLTHTPAPPGCWQDLFSSGRLEEGSRSFRTVSFNAASHLGNFLPFQASGSL